MELGKSRTRREDADSFFRRKSVEEDEIYQGIDPEVREVFVASTRRIDRRCRRTNGHRVWQVLQLAYDGFERHRILKATI